MMIRLTGLIIVTLLVCFTVLYSNAPKQMKEKLPAPIRDAALSMIEGTSEMRNGLNGSLGTKFRQGLRRTTTDIKVATGVEAPVSNTGLIAINEDLTGADYTSRLIANSSFTRATLDGANFTNTFMDNTEFDSASLKGAIFQQTVMTKNSARGAIFTDATFTEADLTRAMAHGADFSGVHFQDTLFSSSQFSGATFIGTVIMNSYGDKSIYFSVDFTDARISNTDFSKANFEKAKFPGAVIIRSDFTKASFTETDFSGADFSTALGLTQKQLDAACGDALTKLPPELTIITCEEMVRRKEEALLLLEQARIEKEDLLLPPKAVATETAPDIVETAVNKEADIAMKDGDTILIPTDEAPANDDRIAAEQTNKPVSVQPASITPTIFEDAPETISAAPVTQLDDPSPSIDLNAVSLEKLRVEQGDELDIDALEKELEAKELETEELASDDAE